MTTIKTGMAKFYQLADKQTEFLTKAVLEDAKAITDVGIPVRELQPALLRLPWAIRQLAQRGCKITISIEKGDVEMTHVPKSGSDSE